MLAVSATTISVAAVAASLSGLLGALTGAYLTSRHDRRERFRALRVEAATAFVRACADALLQTSLAANTIERRRDEVARQVITAEEAGAQMGAEANKAAQFISEARAKRALVGLLFGIGSPTETIGAALLSDLHKAIDALQPAPDPAFDFPRANELHETASLQMESLTERATDAILRTGSARDFLSRTSRFRRRLRERRQSSEDEGAPNEARETAAPKDGPDSPSAEG